jgi:hypothetical protein
MTKYLSATEHLKMMRLGVLLAAHEMRYHKKLAKTEDFEYSEPMTLNPDPSRRRYTPEEYLAIEEGASYKSEGAAVAKG